MAETRAAGSRARYARGSGTPHPIDVHVGKRIRIRRLFLGMNQETLASALCLTFQQVQKYESGANRISASRLAATAKVLGVPIAYFFDDLAAAADDSAEATALRIRLEQPETIALVRFYYAFPDDAVRRQFLQLVQSAAGANA